MHGDINRKTNARHESVKLIIGSRHMIYVKYMMYLMVYDLLATMLAMIGLGLGLGGLGLGLV